MANYSMYTGPNAYFINPYNFITVDFDKEPEKISVKEGFKGHSGVLHCELQTKTPLLIPDMEKVPNTSKHRKLPFMCNPNGVPMIPGSAIRGPIRSMYETLTNSCMSTVDVNQSITYRTKDAFKPGLLIKDETGVLHLYSAKRYIFGVNGGSYSRYNEQNLFKIEANDLTKYSYGQRVYITAIESNGKEKTFRTSKGFSTISVFIEDIKNEKEVGYQEGYVCIGEPFNNKKHFESVFVKLKEVEIAGNDKAIKSLEKAWKDLSYILKCYNDDKVNPNAKNHQFYSGRKYGEMKIGQPYPIWYKSLEQDGRITNFHLSVANLGRAAYNKNMGEMINEHKACTKREKLCPACRLFGMTGDDALGSRVRITDAVKISSDNLLPYVVLKELSSPKISYMPFYLRKKKGNIEKNISYDNDLYTIRGRKFYWHNIEPEAWKDPDNRKTERNASAELVDKGSIFKFDVYYDELSDEELKTLIWTITIGENDLDGKQCYKIGHGKPIGLGSVKIIIKSRDDRVFDGKEYTMNHEDVITIEDAGTIIKDKSTLNQIKMITDLNRCIFKVDYPGIVDGCGNKYHDESNAHASHQWFTSNFTLGKAPQQMLPEIGSEGKNEQALKWRTEANRVESHNNRQFRNNTGTQNPRRERKIIVRKVKPDFKDSSKKVAEFEGGIVFDIPDSVNVGDTIIIRVTKQDDNGRVYGIYVPT